MANSKFQCVLKAHSSQNSSYIPFSILLQYLIMIFHVNILMRFSFQNLFFYFRQITWFTNSISSIHNDGNYVVNKAFTSN